MTRAKNDRWANVFEHGSHRSTLRADDGQIDAPLAPSQYFNSHQAEIDIRIVTFITSSPRHFAYCTFWLLRTMGVAASITASEGAATTPPTIIQKKDYIPGPTELDIKPSTSSPAYDNHRIVFHVIYNGED